ncbi:conserved Plasmodium protein, unknown function [Plasmodium ovale wallikeri]|uniref:Uncharacterized protein n=1 Tax=Plasmodium ovale wallikeri TaxID=864142 RepID=A0A1A8YJC5_PLAOA|nr:conserved Plasmodium protein, unknown function [Plasmodium ovale wallikeri]
MQYSPNSHFQFISEHVFCFLKDSYICILNLLNNEKRYLYISCSEDLTEVLHEQVESGEGVEAQTDLRNMSKIQTYIKINVRTKEDEKQNSMCHVRKFFCNKNDHSLVVVIQKNDVTILCHILFNEIDNLSTFEVGFTKRIKAYVKDVAMTRDNIFVLIKKSGAAKAPKGAKLKGDEGQNGVSARDDANHLQNKDPTGENKIVPSNMPSDMPSDMPSGMPSDMPSGMPSGMPSDIPNHAAGCVVCRRNADYFLYIFGILGEKRQSLKKMLISNTSYKLKKMIVCPYDESKIILLSKKSILFNMMKKKPVNLKNGNVSKELVFNSYIVTTTWLDFYIFVVCLSNNELLFFKFSENSGNFLCFKCVNNYSKITSLFYKKNLLFIAFSTKELVSFKVNYDAISQAIFKKASSIEGNCLNIKYLFKKKKGSRTKKKKKEEEESHDHLTLRQKKFLKEDEKREETNPEEVRVMERGNKETKININKKKKRKKRIVCTYKSTFDNILHEIKELECKINSNNCDILKESDEEKWSYGPTAEENLYFCPDIGKRQDMENHRKGENGVYGTKGENSSNIPNGTHAFFFSSTLSRLRRRKKRKFARFRCDGGNVIGFLRTSSTVNLQKYVGSKIRSFCFNSSYLLILLETGLLYYTRDFNEKRGVLEEESSFYFCTHISLQTILDVKISRGDRIFTLDNLHVLKILSVKSKELNIICMKGKIASFEFLSILGKNNCLFLSLMDGSFYIINMSNHKILLYSNVDRFVKGKKVEGGKREHIERVLFNRVDETVLNGCFKIGHFFFSFYLIYSISHQKMFIYFVHKIDIKKMLHSVDLPIPPRDTDFSMPLRVSSLSKPLYDTTESKSRSCWKETSPSIVLNISTYRCEDTHYFCFLAADQSLTCFCFFFVELTSAENVANGGNNRVKNNIRVFFFRIPMIRVVYAKVIGNYLVVVDYFLNIVFFYLKKEYFYNPNISPSRDITSFMDKKCFITRVKNKRGAFHRSHHSVGSDETDTDVEAFLLRRRRRKKKGEENKSRETTKAGEGEKGTGVTSGEILFELNLGVPSFHVHISEKEGKFINERDEVDGESACSIDIVTKSNVIVTLRFHHLASPSKIKPDIRIWTATHMDKVSFFHPLKIGNRTCFLLLNRRKNFHMQEISADEGAGASTESFLEKGKGGMQDVDAYSPQIEYPENRILRNSFEKNIHNDLNFSLYKLSDSEGKPQEVPFFLSHLNIVFLKIYNTPMRRHLHMHNRRRRCFHDVMESGDFRKGEEVTEGVVSTGGGNCFFDNETIIFTFLNDNEYNLSLSCCLKNSKIEGYLDGINRRKREEGMFIDRLRRKLKELIRENENGKCIGGDGISMALERECFFFDRRYINESEILLREYEDIKEVFECERRKKEKTIRKLERKCGVLGEIDFLYGFRKNIYVANVYDQKKKNTKNYCMFRKKIKLLRFLQIKESYFVQNMEKNNNLSFLKTTKDYIDRYLEDFSSLFCIHYYSFTNINLNFLSSNLFNLVSSDSETDGLHWNYLLYHPHELFTNARKRIQCFVLQVLAAQQKAKLRVSFLSLKEERDTYLKEIIFILNKLKLSLEEVEKYMTYPYSHKIDLSIFHSTFLRKVKLDTATISNNLDPDSLIKITLNKLSQKMKLGIEDEERYSVANSEKDTTTREKNCDAFFPSHGKELKDVKSEPERGKGNSRVIQICDTATSENMEIYEKRKSDLRNKLADIRSYIYQINEQCDEFDEKLKLLQRKKRNIQKQTILHEFYCVSIYALLKNEHNKSKVLKRTEKEQKKVALFIKELSMLINSLEETEIDDVSLKEKRDLLLEVIGFELDPKRNIFLKKKVIQKHLMDTNQIMHEHFELETNIRKMKEEIYKNKIKNNYLKFLLMDIEEGVNDVKYLKQNCEFLFCDIDNVISSLEKKKKNREIIFQMSEQRLREQINNMDSKIMAIKCENVVLEKSMQSLIREINEISNTNTISEIGESNEESPRRGHVAKGTLQGNKSGEDDQKSGKKSAVCSSENSSSAENTRGDGSKALRMKDIYERSAMLKKKYK